MNSTTELLDRVIADLDAVLSDDALAGLSDAERVAVLQGAGAAFRRAEAVIVETVATGEMGGFPHAAGCRGENELLQRTLLVDARGAARVDRVVDLVRRPLSLAGERMPARWSEMRLALLDGVVGVAGFLAATGPIERVWDRLSVDQRLAADVALAGCARGHGLDAGPDDDADADEDAAGPSPTVQDLKSLAEDLASMFDPDGEEPKDEDARRRRGITIGRLKDGMHAIRGYLTPDAAAQLQLIMDAMLNPKGDGPPMPGVFFAPSADADADSPDTDFSHAGADADAAADPEESDPFNSDPRCVLDDRTAAQKRHDALAAALGIAARHKDMPTLGGASPVVVVTVDAKDLVNHGTANHTTHPTGATGAAFGGAAFGHAGSGAGGNGGWATIPGSGAHVPVSVAAHVACSGAIQRVLMDEGRIVGIATTDRIFTVHQRRAIIARDKECLIPGCHVPASWCEIHHVTEHARGGPTHTDNGVPLCWWHHRSLGTSGWEIRMNDGLPQVRGPAWWDPAQRWRTPRLSLRQTAPLARTG
ncbi:HNH endonuclease signature motif containing protein [Microbacterium sp. APC 3901]|uniref:HNH endonuclease signature motif containing protein n=1 Tax=Microbacterium sp. APC 3901 TaxID=3035192 RepID=UPI0025B54E7B|nr:HNH endonuclease signature motif containing protein [Microbacterium sp. APC 3901]MDN3444216.1 HNH endonuclease signature motif containing protein [Microbacterium sp. APC 3901]